MGCLWLASRLLPTAQPQRGFTHIGLAVFGLAAWIFASNVWIHSSYSAFAIYHAGLLASGYLLGRRADRPGATVVYTVAVAFTGLLSVWALWQLATEGDKRPHALFDTPATVTAVLNLVLVPGLVWIAAAPRRSRPLEMAVVVISAAVFAANSRGGWLAAAAAGLVAVLLIQRSGIRIERGRQIRLIAVLLAGWLIVWLTSFVGSGLGTPTYALPSADAGISLLARLGMYKLAWQSLSLAALPVGSGYLTFFYLMRSHPGAVPDYENAITYFVHDDYLQALLELGVPGLAGLLGITVLPMVLAWRAMPRVRTEPGNAVVIAAAAAALASMAFHAVVDFPFYVPACVAMYGIGLGVLEAYLRRPPGADPAFNTIQRPRLLRRAVTAALGTLACWVLGTSLGAEAAVHYAISQWQRSQNERAAYWFEVAQRLEPRDWRFHWQAGQFWFTQAVLGGKPAAARLADRAYAAAIDANPREVFPRVARIALHRRFGALLGSPVDTRTLLAWADRAVELAPADRGARREREQLVNQLRTTGSGPAK
jgi:O-antigen ligase